MKPKKPKNQEDNSTDWGLNLNEGWEDIKLPDWEADIISDWENNQLEEWDIKLPEWEIDLTEWDSLPSEDWNNTIIIKQPESLDNIE